MLVSCGVYRGGAEGPMISDADIERVTAAARGLPPAVGVYVEDDFVTNLLATVVDFQMHTNAVVKALGHFKEHRFDEVRTMAEVQTVMGRFPDDQDGNTGLAVYLWGYRLWTRAAMLRRLVEFFDSIGVRDQAGLKRWGERAEFRRDFEGRVKGLGPAVFPVAGHEAGRGHSEAGRARPPLRRGGGGSPAERCRHRRRGGRSGTPTRDEGLPAGLGHLGAQPGRAGRCLKRVQPIRCPRHLCG